MRNVESKLELMFNLSEAQPKAWLCKYCNGYNQSQDVLCEHCGLQRQPNLKADSLELLVRHREKVRQGLRYQ